MNESEVVLSASFPLFDKYTGPLLTPEAMPNRTVNIQLCSKVSSFHLELQVLRWGDRDLLNAELEHNHMAGRGIMAIMPAPRATPAA